MTENTPFIEVPPFKEGDLVYLKSGSARLTVTRVLLVEGVDAVEVIWAPYNGTTIEKATVPAIALRKAI